MENIPNPDLCDDELVGLEVDDFGSLQFLQYLIDSLLQIFGVINSNTYAQLSLSLSLFSSIILNDVLKHDKI
jgi:hypothetical protein